MKRFQQLTRSYVTLSLFALAILVGFSGMAFADEDMDKGMGDTMSEPMDKDMDDMMSEGMVNVNVATAKQLETLPGIGKELAQRIIDYRTSAGAFKSVQELVKVKGIGKETLAKMEARLMVDDDDHHHTESPKAE